MVATYNILGQKVASHWLAIATLATTFVGAGLATSGKKPEGQKTPPINASSKDEEKFIQEFIRSAEAEGGDGKKREGGGH